MRLKIFTAATMSKAMEMVRDELGKDAIIVSTRRGPSGRGVRITAAVEQSQPQQRAAFPFSLKEGEGGEEKDQEAFTSDQIVAFIDQTLKNHGTPGHIVDRLVNTVKIFTAGDPRMALAAALDGLFRFAPLFETKVKHPFIFVGPPGGGKTVSVAKLATNARMHNQPVNAVTTDIVRAGGVEQLAALTKILKLDLKVAATPEALLRKVEEVPAGELVLIDTAGTNPFNNSEMAELSGFIQAVSAEPILVLSAGGDAVESAEIAEAFSALGATRILITRLDLARRLGSLLAAADMGKLRFCNVSITPNIGEGLNQINPVALARLLQPELLQNTNDLEVTEAAL